MFYVYVIKSESTGKIYIGQTSNLEKRIARHNGLLPSRSKSYTKINKGPWNIIFEENYKSRIEAITREKYLKSHIGRDWLKNKISGV